MTEEEHELEPERPVSAKLDFRLISAEYVLRHFWRRREDQKIRAFLRGQIDVVRELRKKLEVPH